MEDYWFLHGEAGLGIEDMYKIGITLSPSSIINSLE